MRYCTYAEYQLLGGRMSETDFAVWGLRASRRIDRLTYGRAQTALANHPSLAEPLADACAQIADLLQAANGGAAAAVRGLSSATTDGYSESYATDGAGSGALARRCYAAMTDALGSDPHGLLYAGV